MSIFKDVKEDAVQKEEMNTKDDLFTVVSEDEQDDVVCTMSSPFGEIWGEKGRENGKRQKGKSTGVTLGGWWVTFTSVVQT